MALGIAIQTARSEAQDLPLFLEVFINGEPTNLIAEFSLDQQTLVMSSPRSELIEVGIAVPRNLRGMVVLDDVPGLSYSYDQSTQTIAITASNDAKAPDVISANRRPAPIMPEGSFGAVVNYDLVAGFGSGSDPGSLDFNQFSLGLDGWVFTPIGTLSHSGIFSGTDFDDSRFLRLNTTFEYNAPGKALTFAVGDVVTSSMPWGRSIRIGGVQLRRDFGLRSDLITEPLLSFDGAAALPSTVDVFIDNNRVYSGRTSSGPFRFEDIPIYNGAGDAVVVVRDENGNVTRREVGFFAARNLLKKGVADYSFEVGYARESYGQESDDYGQDAVFSGSLRFGLTNRVTLQTHVEAKSDLTLLGVGASFVVADRVEVTLVGGGSEYRGTRGYFGYGTVHTDIGRFRISGSVLRSSDGFADLAYATAIDAMDPATASLDESLLEFPRAQDVLSVTFLINDHSHMGISFVNAERETSSDRILAMNYGHRLDWRDASLSLNAAYDFEANEPRLAAYFSVPLGNRTYTQLNAVMAEDGSMAPSLNLTRALGEDVGEYGYQANIVFGQERPAWQVIASLRTRYGRAEASLRHVTGSTSGHVRFGGSLVLAGGQIMAGPTVHDGFAVVNAGVPYLPIYLHNREIARTGANGFALIPGLASFGENRLSLDVDELPDGAWAGVTAMNVVPARKSGVVVDFGGSDLSATAVVILRDPSGAYLPVGSEVQLKGKTHIVGYDGVAYLEGLEPTNEVKVKTPSGSCVARFAFAAQDGPQTIIDSVTCL